jgi:hypothetical protein
MPTDLMTANSAIHPSRLALRASRPSRVGLSQPGSARRRTSGLQLVPTSLVPTGEGPRSDIAPQAVYRGLHLLAETRGSGPQPPPPSAFLYWAVWLCSVCLLLLATT